MKFYVCLFVFMLQQSFPVFAQNAGNPDQNKPLEITAEESLEWHRNELFFRAKKNVHAVQGETTLVSDVLTAQYTDEPGGGIKIYRIEAEGSVKIASEKSTAYGQKAVYDVEKGYAIMTGGNLRLTSDDQIVTARDKFEYWVNSGRLEAHGNARAVREGDELLANRMIAIFSEDRAGKRTLKSLEAIGNVVITTPDEVLKGDRAVYSAQSNVAELIDNVTVKRGPNVLEGSRAEVNLATNVSKMFGAQSTETDGRVRGVFYPGTQNKSE